MKYDTYVWFSIIVCFIALFACIIIGSVYEFDMPMLVLFTGAAEFVLIWIFVAIGRGYCQNCGKYGKWREIRREFKGIKTIERNVTVPSYRTYKIDGKKHFVEETRTEKQYEDVEVWKCRERCMNCGFERIVERTR